MDVLSLKPTKSRKEHWNLISVLFGERRISTLRLRPSKHEGGPRLWAPEGPGVHLFLNRAGNEGLNESFRTEHGVSMVPMLPLHGI